jgi:hypothetical protein
MRRCLHISQLKFSTIERDFEIHTETSLSDVLDSVDRLARGMIDGFFVERINAHALSGDEVLRECAEIVGTRVVFPNSKYGHTPVHPIEGDAINLAAQGYNADWHTEDSVALIPPFMLALFCECGDPAVQTLVGAYEDPRFEADEIAALSSPTHTALSEISLHGERMQRHVPILFPSGEGLGIRYDPAMLECVGSPTSTCPARRLKVGDVMPFALAAGNLLVLNNHRFAHARLGAYSYPTRKLLRILADQHADRLHP